MSWKMKLERNWGQLDMKSDFITKPLSKLASIQTGPFGSQLHKKDYVKHGTPIVTVEHLGQKRFTEQNLPCVSNEDKMRLNKYILRKGDIVFSRVGAVDRCSFVSKEYNGWMFSGRCLRVRPSSEIEPEYLYYFFNLAATKQFIRGIATGATMPSINTKFMGEVPITYPKINIQRNIVAVLNSLDEKIQLNIEINKNLLQQAGAVFDKFYEESPNQQSFNSFIRVLGGGTPKTGNSDFWNGPIPFFTPKDVGVPYTFQTEKHITESGLAHCNSRLYQKDTTFVTARGTVGKVSLAGTPMAMNQSCYALVSDVIDPLLVYFYVLKAVASLKHKASGAVFDAIVTRDFDSETINLLSDNDSKSVLSIIRPMMEAIHNNSKENIRLVALRDSLLPRLMLGELDVSKVDL